MKSIGKISKLCKYFFLLSIFFGGILFAHTIIIYLYAWADKSPERGGTISVGMVSDAPSLNPMLFWLKPENDYVLRFLYRSILHFNQEKNTFEGDLMNCDLSRGISRIRCFPNPGMTWSNGKTIITDDILTTFKYLASSDVNMPMKKLLSLVTINNLGDSIEFTTTTSDTSLLDIFLFPILSSESVQKIEKALQNGEHFDYDTFPTSGEYTFTRRESDEKVGAKKITLSLGSQPKTTSYIEKYVFYFFNDSGSLSKNKDRISLLFVPDTDTHIDDIRFEKRTYYFPEYSAAFLNSERLPNDLRQAIAAIIKQSAKELSLDENEAIEDIFFSSGILQKESSGSTNLAAALRKLGYVSKKDRENQAATRTKIAAPSATSVSAPLSPFDFPTKESAYFTGQISDILLGGKVPKDVVGVLINGYKLKQYTTGDARFSYRARADLGNLHEGKNTFGLVFEYADGKKTPQGNLLIFIIPNDGERQKAENEWSTAHQTTPIIQVSTPVISNSGSSSELSVIQKLTDGNFYNQKNEPFTIHIVTSTRPLRITDYFSQIKKNLEKAGIVVTSEELDQEGVSKLVNDGVKNYDIFLGGIHLGVLADNIFPFFLSGQSAKGYNFSRIKNPRLDILLGLMRNTILRTDKNAWEDEIRTILSNEAAVVPLFRTPYTFFIDRNISNDTLLSIIPDFSFLTELTDHSYVREAYTINLSNKSTHNFIEWIHAAIIDAVALFY